MHPAIDEDLLRHLLDADNSFGFQIEDLDTINKNVLSTSLTVDPSPASAAETRAALVASADLDSSIASTTEVPDFTAECGTPSSTSSLTTPLFGGFTFPSMVPYGFSQDSPKPSFYLHPSPNIQTPYPISDANHPPFPFETPVPPLLYGPTYHPLSDPCSPTQQQASGWDRGDMFNQHVVMDLTSGHDTEPQGEVKGPNRVKRTRRRSAPYKDHEGAEIEKNSMSQQEFLSEMPGYETFGNGKAPKCATRRHKKKSNRSTLPISTSASTYPPSSSPSSSRQNALSMIRGQARSKHPRIEFVYVNGNEWA